MPASWKSRCATEAACLKGQLPWQAHIDIALNKTKHGCVCEIRWTTTDDDGTVHRCKTALSGRDWHELYDNIACVLAIYDLYD